ncbi:LysM peptidoglycan-binding domain-containing protein [Caballeronia novacaledonica]|uniref:LysM peptidoglycan-binding domain-containing protein n=1 Tax=Caballeronia novacaledonica TaxID=1544861 RepID=A0ACB5QUN5_9BURK|nr:LysM peptidoglycan-binding domain-containing protein [Caballeronia novacaledonica]
MDNKTEIHRASSIRLRLQDRYGNPIRGLEVDIRGIDEDFARIYHSAKTDAEGFLHFAVAKGHEVAVQVKRWTDDCMKTVARLKASADTLEVRLTSPKTLHKISTNLDVKHGGEYRRGTHVVKKGETLTSIAKKYHTSVDYLKHVNRLSSDLIIENGILKVPPSARKTGGKSPTVSRQTSGAGARPNSAPTKTRASTTPAQTTSAPATPDRATSVQEHNDRGGPTHSLRQGAPAIIFPLRLRPLNDNGGIYGKTGADYVWDKQLNDPGQTAPRFGADRGGGRRHAGRDLYVDKHTEIVAIAPGIVTRCAPFYCQTDQITIHHMTSDGRQFVVRYGEVDPSSIKVTRGDQVQQGQIIAKSGVLINNGRLLSIVGSKNVSMLHFEAYSGALGYENTPSLTDTNASGFQRRRDLIDPLAILTEGYRATFLDAQPTPALGDRIPIDRIVTSSRGKEFIRGWEGVHFDQSREKVLYYNDSKGYCTVGWGHLIAKKSCEELGFVPRVSSISKKDGLDLFDSDVMEHEHRLKSKISVALFQYEFDALMSLVFNLGGLEKTPQLCRKLNNQDYKGAVAEFLDIENRSRRQSEHDLFTSGTYNWQH